jgi:uncharacterized protein (TIRG00374 family)
MSEEKLSDGSINAINLNDKLSKVQGPKGKNKKSKKALFIRSIVSCSLLFLLFQKVSFAGVIALFAKMSHHGHFLLAALFMPLFGILASGLRLKVVLSAQGINIPLIEVCKANVIGLFYNQVLPSTIGGDIAKSVWISKLNDFRNIPKHSTDPFLTSFTIVGVDRLIGITGLLSTGIFAACWAPKMLGQASVIANVMPLSILCLLIIVFLPFAPLRSCGKLIFSIPLLNRIRGKATSIYRTLKGFKNAKTHLLVSYLLSILLQLIVIIQYYILSLSLEIQIAFLALCFLIPLVTLISMLPVTVNGIGLREGALLALGETLGMTPDSAVALAWAFLIFNLVPSPIGACIYIRQSQN